MECRRKFARIRIFNSALYLNTWVICFYVYCLYVVSVYRRKVSKSASNPPRITIFTTMITPCNRIPCAVAPLDFCFIRHFPPPRFRKIPRQIPLVDDFLQVIAETHHNRYAMWDYLFPPLLGLQAYGQTHVYTSAQTSGIAETPCICFYPP